MGYKLDQHGFSAVIGSLLKDYRIYAPVRKTGEGRFTDVDVIRYDEITEASEMELRKKSDYAFKEILTPLSETIFYFTENEVTVPGIKEKKVLVFLRSCDLHAVKRLDQIYLENGREQDPYYKRIREQLLFVLIGCQTSYADCFCVDMKSNRSEDGFVFSVDESDGTYCIDVREDSFEQVFSENAQEELPHTASYVTENETRVNVPEVVPNTVYQSSMWDEYTTRCINCGRCNFVCPTCTCYTMQDIFYTDNGKVGERRRVAASCMVDGYTNVAGGGQYRIKNGDRMRFKVLHKVYDFRRRFGYDMCVGCGRCDMVCPEYISFSNCINKLNRTIEEECIDEK